MIAGRPQAMMGIGRDTTSGPDPSRPRGYPGGTSRLSPDLSARIQ
jgi:hypothetical protein